MRKILLLLSIILTTFLAHGQKIVITPDGIRDASDLDKSYVIISADGKSAKELYSNALKWVNKNYQNPKEVIKGQTESEYLSFVTYKPNIIFIRNGIKIYFNGKYTTELSFKEGKVKYNIINLEIKQVDNPTISLMLVGGTFDWALYNKRGEIKNKNTDEAKIDLETYFNNQIEMLSLSLNNVNLEPNW